MDYCRMIYEIFKTDQGVWAEMIGRLLDRCADKVPVVRLIFYAAPADNREYLQWKRELQQLVDERFPAPRPVVSLVAQRPLDTGLVMEVHGLEPDFQGKVTEVAMEGEGYYLRIEKEGFREVLLGGVCGEDPDMPVTQQAEQAFGKAEKVLLQEGMHWGDVVRQWNYLEWITGYSDGNQRYQDFNDVRSRFYASSVWPAGDPAATGIGTQHGGVMIDLNAIVADPRKLQIVPLDNDLQVAAHSYSDKVLFSRSEQKTTPKFERAKVVSDGEHGLVYISGTAAIRGENSLQDMGVLVQTGTTMENIEHLIAPENLQKAKVNPVKKNEMKLLRVYLKHPEAIDPVKIYMDRLFTSIPVAYLLADVCRDELLVEIEGIATFWASEV